MAKIDKDMNGYKITHLNRKEAEAILESIQNGQTPDDTLAEIISGMDDILKNGSW